MRIQPIFCTPIQRTNFKSSNKAEEQIKRQEDELHKEEDEIKKQMDFLNREQHKLDNEEYKLGEVTLDNSSRDDVILQKENNNIFQMTKKD